MNSARASSLAIRSSSRRRSGSRRRQPVVLLGRSPQRLREQGPRVDGERELTPPGTEDVPSAPSRSPRSSETSRSNDSWPEDVRACVELDPPGSVHEVEEGGLPWPRRAASRPATRARASVSSPAGSSAHGAFTAAIEMTPGTRAGTARPPRRAARRACAGAGRRVRRSHLGDVDLGDLELRALPLGSCTSTMSLRLLPSSALPTGDSLESLFSPGSPRSSRRSCTGATCRSPRP